MFLIVRRALCKKNLSGQHWSLQNLEMIQRCAINCSTKGAGQKKKPWIPGNTKPLRPICTKSHQRASDWKQKGEITVSCKHISPPRLQEPPHTQPFILSISAIATSLLLHICFRPKRGKWLFRFVATTRQKPKPSWALVKLKSVIKARIQFPKTSPKYTCLRSTLMQR